MRYKNKVELLVFNCITFILAVRQAIDGLLKDGR